MRGKDSIDLTGILEGGITPARAGKSIAPNIFRYANRDHPRACGEKSVGDIEKAMQVGSPPRVRGKETVMKEIDLLSGITPARAGKRLKDPSNQALF